MGLFNILRVKKISPFSMKEKTGLSSEDFDEITKKFRPIFMDEDTKHKWGEKMEKVVEGMTSNERRSFVVGIYYEQMYLEACGLRVGKFH